MTKAIWENTNSGHFTLHSGWDIIRKKRNHNNTTNKIWNNRITFNMAFLLMRKWLSRASILSQDVIVVLQLMRTTTWKQ